jgi:hypothetical protein
MAGSLWFGLICVVVFALVQTYKCGRSIFG